MRRIHVTMIDITEVTAGVRYWLTVSSDTEVIKAWTQPGSPVNQAIAAGEIQVGQSGTATLRPLLGRQYLSHWLPA
jgi:hypothetical protein